MTPERWQEVSRIYHAALARTAPERDAFVREACGGDDALCREIASLLAQPSSDGFLAAAPDVARLTGQRLGACVLGDLIGAGGMGEVYRARDEALGRDVAIKILPARFAGDPERLARFEREARLLAALNHPNIAAIYGVAETAGLRGLVLELVEGETLAQRLARGPLSMADALALARALAGGLEAAHERGIVHRDLKPANINVARDGTVKILDFGLAKALARADGTEAPSPSPDDTIDGRVLGTPSYMSPEQARGKPVDRRTDVWAFGCVLYEMLCGRAAFEGDTAQDTLAKVLEHEPDLSRLPAATPAAVRRLLARCLAKDPRERLRDMGDARLDLDDPHDRPQALEPRRAGRLPFALSAATAAVALGGLAWFAWLKPGPTLEPVQFTLSAEGQTLMGGAVPSPDGRHLVFAARTLAGEVALWTRPLGSSAARRLAGTDDAYRPFWSPDGASIGFSADGALKRAPFAGGPVQRITSLDPESFGATWNRDNVIVFAPSNKTPLHRVPAAGGPSEPLTTLNPERRENSHRWPHFLPDGRHFLFTARSDLPDRTGIYVASIDAPQSPKWLGAARSGAIYVSTGHVLFVRDQTLLAQPFDLRSLALTGEPVAISGGLALDTSAALASHAASADGTVVTFNSVPVSRLVWFDRTGRELGTVAARGNFAQVRLAPNEAYAAVFMPDPDNGDRDLWSIALGTGAVTRLTSDPASDWFPVWSPDSTEVIYASDREPTPTFYRTAVTGGGHDELVFRAPRDAGSIYPTDWSRDGRTLIFHSYPRGDISRLGLPAVGAPVPLVQSRFTEWIGALSPDGRWLAYVSDESGREEVYVKPIEGTERYRVSVNGGIQPRWRRDGRELFFLGAADKLFSVSIGAGPGPAAGAPVFLFDGCRIAADTVTFMYRYDVSADGRRSLWICDGNDRSSTTVAIHALASATRR